jgi:V/A-type H+-transporting ATPase subunit K
MVTKQAVVKLVALTAVFLAVFGLGAPLAMAQEDHGAAAEESGGGGLGAIGLGIGAGLAVGLAGLGTGLAQSGVGAGGTGAMAEKPELFTNVLILFAIPETIVILGFVIGFLLLNAV